MIHIDSPLIPLVVS